MNAMPVAPPGELWPQPRAARDDGFVVLEACHRRMLAAADALEELVQTHDRDGVTRAVRASAAVIADFYSTTARRHHEDEERHVFPALLASSDAELVQMVLRLQQDHGWLEEDWMELEPHVQAIATGYGTYDIDTLRQGVPIFAALHRDHIALEESLAYPGARARLGSSERREMGREMAARRRAERRHDARNAVVVIEDPDGHR